MSSPPSDAAAEPANWREAEPSADEARTLRERRLRIRCWRRGTKEMDLILGGFFDSEAAKLSDGELSAFEALIREDDAAIYAWVSGAAAAPKPHAAIIERLRRCEEATAERG